MQRLWALWRHRENFYTWQPALDAAFDLSASARRRGHCHAAVGGRSGSVLPGAVRERLKNPATGPGRTPMPERPPAPAPRDHPSHVKLRVRLPGRAGPCRHTNERPVPRRASPGPRRAPAPLPRSPGIPGSGTGSRPKASATAERGAEGRGRKSRTAPGAEGRLTRLRGGRRLPGLGRRGSLSPRASTETTGAAAGKDAAPRGKSTHLLGWPGRYAASCHHSPLPVQRRLGCYLRAPP